MDIAKILELRFSDKEWTLNNNEYDQLTWLSDGKPPTKKALEDLWEEVKLEIEAEQTKKEAEQTKKDADRASAMAKLSKLGLTDDEIASLIP
jgi:hypothetical protein